MREKVFVILPTYNDFEHLPKIIPALLKLKYEIVVVNDGSEKAFPWPRREEKSPLHYLSHSENLGQGAALQSGMDYVRAQGGSYCFHFDADGQHSSTDLPKMLSLMKEEKLAIVLGSRFLNSETQRHIPLRRQWLLKLARIFNNALSGLALSDAHNGLRLFHISALEKIQIRQNRMAHASEITQGIARHSLAWREYPSQIIYLEEGHQKRGIGYILKIVWDLLYPIFRPKNSRVYLGLSLVLGLLAGSLSFLNLFVTGGIGLIWLIWTALFLFYEPQQRAQAKKVKAIRKQALQKALYLPLPDLETL